MTTLMRQPETGWYGPSVKPVRMGVFKRQFPTGILFCKWDGKVWYIGSTSVSGAMKQTIPSLCQANGDGVPWGGQKTPN